MNITGEITFGNLLTAASVLLSAAALTYGWRKDRQFRRGEYADRIRRAAGLIAGKLDRWQTLALQFFDEVQPLLLDVEQAATQRQETAAARYALLRGLYEQRARTAQRIAAEQLDLAYIDLYGYDPRVHGLFLRAVSQMQRIGDESFDQMCELTWCEIAAPSAACPGASPTAVENGLRRQSAAIATAYERATDAVIAAFRTEILKLIVADDDQLLGRAVPLSSASEEGQ